MPRPLGRDTITILKPTITIDPVDNTELIDFTTPTEIVVPFCFVQPFLPADKLQFEITSDRDYSRATWVAFAPSTPDTREIEPHDRIEFDGDTYEVFGKVGAWRRFNGSNHHVQIILQTREG